MALAVLAIMMVLMSAPSVRAAVDRVGIDRLEQQLREAHYARIGVGGRTHVLMKPQPGSEGLGYEDVRDDFRHLRSMAGDSLVCFPVRFPGA